MNNQLSDNKKIAVNSIFVFIKLVFSSVVSIFTSRWVLARLGIEDYGIYNVVGSIVIFLNVINTSMITTTYRYIAFEIGKGKDGNTNAVFNRSFLMHIGLAILILLLSESLGVFYLNNYMKISPDKLSDANFVLQISILTTIISTISVPFQGLLTANERFSTTTIIIIIADVYKILAVLWLTHYNGNALRAYSIIMMIMNCIPLLMYATICYKDYYYVIKWNLQKEWYKYKEMISFSTWILLGAFTSICKHQGAQIIINFFWGTLLNAAFAVANQINHVLQTFSNNISVAANPQITKSYSGGNQNRTINITCVISKISAFILMVIGLPFFIETDFIFNLWLKEVPEYAVSFCRLMTILALIDTLGAGIPALTQATGKIKVFQIVSSIWSLLCLPIAIIAYKFGGKPESITIIYIVSSLIYVGIRLYLLKMILNFDIKYFIKESYIRILYVLIPMSLLIFIYFKIQIDGWMVLVGISVSEIILILLIWILGLSKDERNRISNVIKSYIHK